MYHYKDITPEETIKNIEQFFQSKNCKLQKEGLWQHGDSLYSCRYNLIFNNKAILGANGKGVTPILSQASCFAEMYERFCGAQEDICLNYKNYQNYIKANLKKYNYHLTPDEKLIENYNDDLYIRTSCFNQLNMDIEKIIQVVFNNELYAIPYKSINNLQDYYTNPFFMKMMVGTNGLAAGNSIEEALVQGISEIFERQARELFLKYPKFRYYQLDNKNLSVYLQNIINDIEQNKSLKVNIYDLSYNFNIPVCLLIIQDLDRHLYHFNFGSHPVIDIAIERCLTEMYQGYNELSNIHKSLYPSNFISWADLTHQIFKSNEYSKNIIPEHLILYTKKTDYNKKIFLNADQIYSQKDLLNHLISISPINLYYRDISLSDKIYTVRIISDELTNYYLIEHNKKTISAFNEEQKKLCGELILDIFKNPVDLDTFIKIKELSKEKFQGMELFSFIYSLLFCDIFQPMDIQLLTFRNNYELLKYILFQKDFADLKCSLYGKAYQYILSNVYMRQIREYPKEDIKKIMTFLGYDIPIKRYSQEEIIKNVFTTEIYDSKEYQDFIDLFIK